MASSEAALGCVRPRAQQRSPTKPLENCLRSLCRVAVAGDGHTPSKTKTCFGVRFKVSAEARRLPEDAAEVVRHAVRANRFDPRAARGSDVPGDSIDLIASEIFVS